MMRNRRTFSAVIAMLSITGLSACNPPPPPARTCAPAPPRPAGVIVAGTGVGIAPMRLLATQYNHDNPTASRVLVPASIGSGGGLRALDAGAIDVAIVAKLPATSDALVPHHFARVPLIFASGTKTPTLTLDEIAQIYHGERERWPDGTSIVPLYRESTDSSLALITENTPALADALAPPSSSEPGIVLQTDQQMLDALERVEGSIGFIDIGTASSSDHAIESLLAEDASSTWSHDLHILHAAAPRAAVQDFIDYVRSDRARNLLESKGYVFE